MFRPCPEADKQGENTMKYETKYPNIYYYETAKGKRYYIRRSFFFRGKKKGKVKWSHNSLKLSAALAEIEQQNPRSGIRYQY